MHAHISKPSTGTGLAVFYSLLILFTPFHSALSQRQIARIPIGPSITSVQDEKGNALNAITLRQGDSPIKIVINGKNLKTVSAAQLFKNQGVGQGDVGVGIVESLAEKLTLSLQMKTEKVTGKDFHLILLDAKGTKLVEAENIPVELKTATKIQAATPTQKTGAVQTQTVQPAAQKPLTPAADSPQPVRAHPRHNR